MGIFRRRSLTAAATAAVLVVTLAGWPGTASAAPTASSSVLGRSAALAAGPYVAPGRSECSFTPAATAVTDVKNVNRGMSCTWASMIFQHKVQGRPQALGEHLVHVFEWFITEPKSLTMTRGFAIRGIDGWGTLEFAGERITAPFPCGPTPPATIGCSTTETGPAVSIPAFPLKGTWSRQWKQTIALGDNSAKLRSVFQDQLGLVQQPPASPTPAAPIGVPIGREYRCDKEVTTTYSAGCVNPLFRPTVEFDAIAKPVLLPVAKHMKRAQQAGKEGTPATGPLKRDRDETRNNKRNRDACKNFVPEPPLNISCDEYPFKSTFEGGIGASIAPVPLDSQVNQGNTLINQLNASRVLQDDLYYVQITGVPDRSGDAGVYPPLNNLFNNYGDNAGCADWSGADATNSIALPGGQRAWFFSDSYLGNPAARPSLFFTSSVNNSIVVQDGTSMRTITGGNTCREQNQNIPFFDRYAKTVAKAPDQGGFYWTGDHQLVGSDVVKFYYHGRPSGDLWVNDYAAVASIPVAALTSGNPELDVRPQPLTCAAGGPDSLWGTMTLDRTAADGYVYVYGTGAAYPQKLYLARTTRANLTSFGAWQFFGGANADGVASWTGCGGAVSLPIGLALGGSVNEINGAIWLVQKEWGGPSIVAHPATTPWGFGERHIRLYTPPEDFSDPYYYLTYEPRIQRGLTSGGNLILSYNVNATAVNTGCVSAHAYDGKSYRPRFVQIPENWFDQYDATPSGTAVGRTSQAAAAGTIGGVTDWFPHWGQPCPAVPAPTGFTATPSADGSVNLSWTAAGTDVWTYLYQCDASTTACSDRSTCAAEGGGGFTRQFEGLWITDKSVRVRPVANAGQNGHRFVWYVCTTGAKNGKPIGTEGNGGVSPQLSATVTVPAPNAPANLRGTRSGTSLSLAWDEVTFPSTAVYYTPYLWNVSAGQTAADAVALQPVEGRTSTTITLPVAGSTYGVYLKALNFAGASPPSAARQF